MSAIVIRLDDHRKPKETPMDVEFSDHGSLWLARPLTEAGRAWIEDNVSDEAMWHGTALAIEHRYVPAIINGMAEDGLKVTAA